MWMKIVAAGILTLGLSLAAANETTAPKRTKHPSAKSNANAKPATTSKKGTSKAGKKATAGKPAVTAQTESGKEMKSTPFGPVEAKPAEAPAKMQLADDPMLSAKLQGDTVVFTRKTPFGAQTWKKKQSELNDDERNLLARGAGASTSPAAEPAAQSADGKAAGK